MTYINTTHIYTLVHRISQLEHPVHRCVLTPTPLRVEVRKLSPLFLDADLETLTHPRATYFVLYRGVHGWLAMVITSWTAVSGRLTVHQDGRPVGADSAAQVPGCLMVWCMVVYAMLRRRLCTYGRYMYGVVWTSPVWTAQQRYGRTAGYTNYLLYIYHTVYVVLSAVCSLVCMSDAACNSPHRLRDPGHRRSDVDRWEGRHQLTSVYLFVRSYPWK